MTSAKEEFERQHPHLKCYLKKVPENDVKNKVFPRCHSCKRYERGPNLPKSGQDPEKGESGQKFMIILIPMLVF